MSIPATKIARQARIVALVSSGSVHSQAELAELLARDDLQVTQATLSRDLVEVGAVRVRDSWRAILVAGMLISPAPAG
jgi:transcriptional regulator of arginine metabolism